jgi:predicted nucleotidyltransferase
MAGQRAMKNINQIKMILRQHANDLREQYGITDLAVFGSVARGEATEKSDIDIFAEVTRPIGMIALCAAENYLTELLETKVDLVLRRSIRHELRDRILGEAIAV